MRATIDEVRLGLAQGSVLPDALLEGKHVVPLASLIFRDYRDAQVSGIHGGERMDTFEIVGLAALLKATELNPYIFRSDIGPCREDQAVVSAYRIVAEDRTPGVAEYRLLKKGWTAKDVASGIHIHTSNVPICDECWRVAEEKSQTHYLEKAAKLERCSLCGRGTSNGLFAVLPRRRPLN